MGLIKYRIGRDLIDAEEMERVHGRAVQKDLNELDKHDGVVSQAEPDLLECAVRWALGSPAVNKASGWDGIQVKIFKTLKDDAIKCCTQYVSKSGRPSSGHRTGKDQSSSQFPRRAVLKDIQTIRQLRSSPMLVRSCLKSRMRGRLQNYVNQELPDVQAGF